jgi:hypothetical protein
MFTEMPPDGSRIGVVSSAGGESDDQANSLAFVEVIVGRSRVGDLKPSASVQINARQKIID